jgi:hypothetical protein
MNTLDIKTKESNPFKLQKKAKLLQGLADLDNEILEKLVALKNSPKAVTMVSSKSGWQTIREFIM